MLIMSMAIISKRVDSSAVCRLSARQLTASFLSAFGLLFLFPVAAYASPAAVICTVAGYAATSLAAGVGALAVCSIGIAACFGRASWTQAILVGIGCVIMGASNQIAWAIGAGC